MPHVMMLLLDVLRAFPGEVCYIHCFLMPPAHHRLLLAVWHADVDWCSCCNAVQWHSSLHRQTDP